MLTAATGERKNAKKDSSSGGHAAKRNYRKRRGGGGGGGPLGRGTSETVTSAAYESVDPGENGEVVFCSLQASRLVQIVLTHRWGNMWKGSFLSV